MYTPDHRWLAWELQARWEFIPHAAFVDILVPLQLSFDPSFPNSYSRFLIFNPNTIIAEFFALISIGLISNIAMAPINTRSSSISSSSTTSSKNSDVPTKKKFGCSFPSCGKSFSRSEHLHRHALNHKDGNNTCLRCSAHFRRRDLLGKLNFWELSAKHMADFRLRQAYGSPQREG